MFRLKKIPAKKNKKFRTKVISEFLLRDLSFNNEKNIFLKSSFSAYICPLLNDCWLQEVVVFYWSGYMRNICFVLFVLYIFFSGCSTHIDDANKTDDNNEELQLVQKVGSRSTFELITWNIEWFPKSGENTINDVKTIIVSDADFSIIQEKFSVSAKVYSDMSFKSPEVVAEISEQISEKTNNQTTW